MSYTQKAIMPINIVKKTENVIGENCLFSKKNQILTSETEKMIIKGKGFVILDFGKEYFGLLRLLINEVKTNDFTTNIRIRFGESVAETCSNIGYKNASNSHSIRDFVITVTQNSEYQTGTSGFRFVRIDNIEDCELHLVNAQLLSIEAYCEDIVRFSSSDERLNDIFNTAFRTVKLCRQNELIWDGIKRDKLVWIGDLHPESLSIMYTLGEYKRVYDCLTEEKRVSQLPKWINGIPAYSMWYVVVLWEVYFRTGNREYLFENKDYLLGLINQMNYCIDDDGNCDFKRAYFDWDMSPFLDWATFQTPNAEIGMKSLFVYALSLLKNIFKELNIQSNGIKTLNDKIEKWIYFDTDKKQIKAFQCFAKNKIEKEDVDLLIKDGASGLSAFMTYYIFKCISKGGKTENALDIAKKYYGAMLDLGATTFWEDFDIDWIKDNPLGIDKFEQEGKTHIHADYGKFCYTGFRHSLCHGWSTGVIPFIYEEIIGLKIEEVGFKTVSIKPNLCGLKFIDAVIMTPYGKLTVNIKDENGKVAVKYDGPKEVKVLL